jgi:membrane protein involved in colicin uptake
LKLTLSLNFVNSKCNFEAGIVIFSDASIQVRSVSDHLTDADLSSEDVWAKVKQELEELRGACNDKEERIRLLESQVKRQEDTLEEARQDCDRKYVPKLIKFSVNRSIFIRIYN